MSKPHRWAVFEVRLLHRGHRKDPGDRATLIVHSTHHTQAAAHRRARPGQGHLVCPTRHLGLIANQRLVGSPAVTLFGVAPRGFEEPVTYTPPVSIPQRYMHSSARRADRRLHPVDHR